MANFRFIFFDMTSIIEKIQLRSFQIKIANLQSVRKLPTRMKTCYGT